MTETWYLATDWQLFLVSPLFIYPMWRWRKLGLALLAGATLASLAANVAVFYAHRLPPTSMITRPLTMQPSLLAFWVYYYPAPWFRAPAYLVGIFTGWLLYYWQQQQHKSNNNLSPLLSAVGWCTASLAACLVIYGLWPYVNETQVPQIDLAVSVVYGSLHRFGWALAVAWVIVACARGRGGFVNRFLCWPAFAPLGRLTYCTYLLHYNVISVYYARQRQPSYYTTFDQFCVWCGHFVTSLAMAVAVSVAVELPTINAIKLLRNRRSAAWWPAQQATESVDSDAVHQGKTNQGFAAT